MDRGLYLAASGMLAEQVRQNQIANDLANASTPGYKSDRTTQQSFGSTLLSVRLIRAVERDRSLAPYAAYRLALAVIVWARAARSR